MTSVVYLYIVSATSTGDPVNRPWWNSCYIFGYYIHMPSADVIYFLVVSLEVVYLSLNFTLTCGKYMFSLLIVSNFKLVFVFNKKIIWAWTCQSLWNKMSCVSIFRCYTLYSDFCSLVSHMKSGQAVCRNCKSLWMSYIAIILRKSVKASYQLRRRLFSQYNNIFIFYCNKLIVRIHVPESMR